MDMIDWLFGGLIALVLGVCSVLIGDMAYHHYQREHAIEDTREGWEPPVIPSCDQELWDRIKDRCGEQLDEGED